jgi:hypothetical protein
VAIRRISGDEFGPFLRERAYAVVLFDAPWDVGPGSLIRSRFEEAARAFDGRVQFGEVDCDELADVAKAIGLLNVPAVGYFDGGRLIEVLSAPSRTSLLGLGQCWETGRSVATTVGRAANSYGFPVDSSSSVSHPTV